MKILGNIQSVYNSELDSYVIASNTGNAYSISISHPITKYTTGLKVKFQVQSGNSGPSTLKVNGLADIPLKKAVTSDLASGDFTTNQIIEAVYDGTNFQVLTISTTTSGTDTHFFNTDLTGTSNRIHDGAGYGVQINNVPYFQINSADGTAESKVWSNSQTAAISVSTSGVVDAYVEVRGGATKGIEIKGVAQDDTINQVLVLDPTTGYVKWRDSSTLSGGGSSYTFENGLTETAGTVKLGGVLTGVTEIRTDGQRTLTLKIDDPTFSTSFGNVVFDATDQTGGLLVPKLTTYFTNGFGTPTIGTSEFGFNGYKFQNEASDWATTRLVLGIDNFEATTYRHDFPTSYGMYVSDSGSSGIGELGLWGDVKLGIWLNGNTTGAGYVLTDVNGDGYATWQPAAGGTDTNFATNDLTLTANRVHDGAGFSFNFQHTSEFVIGSGTNNNANYWAGVDGGDYSNPWIEMIANTPGTGNTWVYLDAAKLSFKQPVGNYVFEIAMPDNDGDANDYALIWDSVDKTLRKKLLSTLGGGDTNFATNDLTLTANRVHEGGNYYWTLQNTYYFQLASGNNAFGQEWAAIEGGTEGSPWLEIFTANTSNEKAWVYIDAAKLELHQHYGNYKFNVAMPDNDGDANDYALIYDSVDKTVRKKLLSTIGGGSLYRFGKEDTSIDDATNRSFSLNGAALYITDPSAGSSGQPLKISRIANQMSVSDDNSNYSNVSQLNDNTYVFKTTITSESSVSTGKRAQMIISAPKSSFPTTDPRIYMEVYDFASVYSSIDIQNDITISGTSSGTTNASMLVLDQIQLKLQPYTPSNSTDSKYDNGTLAADDSFLYFKTSSGTWKKIAWTTF